MTNCSYLAPTYLGDCWLSIFINKYYLHLLLLLSFLSCSLFSDLIFSSNDSCIDSGSVVFIQIWYSLVQGYVNLS